MSFVLRLISTMGFVVMLATSAVAETISPADAAHHVGKVVTVEGIVSQVSTISSGTRFINYGGKFPNHVFYAVIFGNVAHRFDGVKIGAGTRVAVSGRIEVYKGKPQIVLERPDQVSVR